MFSTGATRIIPFVNSFSHEMKFMKLTKQLFSLVVLVLLLSCNAQTAKTVKQKTIAVEQKVEPITIEFATVDQAKKLLTTEDAYTRAWSKFDIESKSNKVGSTREDFFTHTAAQTMEWTDEEKQKLEDSFARIMKSINDQKFNLQLTESVSLVKTTSKEEGGAVGYTRNNYIVLTESMKGMSSENSDYLLAHELFHVISRKKPELRKKLYSLIGFKMMNEVPYPDAIAEYRISNPDAIQNDSYINLTVGEEQVSCMMILYADRPYDGGSFFNYLNIGFLRLEGESSMKPVIGAEGPEIYALSEVSGFYEQIGRNTNYIMHPEEIMADNFTYAVLGKEELANPELVEAIKKILRE